MSRRSDQGTYVKLVSLFSLSSRMIRFLVSENVPFSILSIPFLLRVSVSNLLQSLNTAAGISVMELDEAYSFFKFSPRRGSDLILLSLMMRCSSDLI